MNENVLSHFQKIHQLSVKNPAYQRVLDELFLFLTRNDHVTEDVTVQTFLPRDILLSKKRGVINVNLFCIVAGLEEIVYLCKKHTKLTPTVFHRSGESVKKRTKILQIDGSAKEILSYERVLLNILQRMSGIATETSLYVAKVKKLQRKKIPFIAATRKTPWMHVDKKAVAVGGGLTHRLDLSDGMLLKDNHLALLQEACGLKSEAEAIVYALERTSIYDQEAVIEVEATTEKAVREAIAVYNTRKRKNPLAILLDNFSTPKAERVLKKMKGKYDLANVAFEASGGINLDNLLDWAKTGVDIISVGALTHSPKAADLSMDIL